VHTDCHQQCRIIVHMEVPRQNSSVKKTIARMFQSTGRDVIIKSLTAFCGYHQCVMGFVGSLVEIEHLEDVLPTDSELEDLDDDYNAAVDRAVCKNDLDAAFATYLSKRDANALSIPQQAAQLPQEPYPIFWLTSHPQNINMYVEHRIDDWQKVVWALELMDLKDRHPEVDDFITFHTHFRKISRMKDKDKLLTTAAKYFAEFMRRHVQHQCTAEKDLVDALKKRYNDRGSPGGYVVRGRCFECNAKVPTGMEGEFYTNLGLVVCKGLQDDKHVMDASKYGIFCRLRCVRGRCKGCGEMLVDGRCPDPDCDDNQKRNHRVAVPLGYGTEDHNEFIGPIDKHFVDQGLLLSWPLCKPKHKCLWHTCKHVCIRSCNHECSRECRVPTCMGPGNMPIPLGHNLCSCDPLWLEQFEDAMVEDEEDPEWLEKWQQREQQQGM
jgi:hypothetical protein